MKSDVNIKRGDVALLSLIVSIIIVFFMGHFLLIPELEKHKEFMQEKKNAEQTQQEMRDLIGDETVYGERIIDQRENLKNISQNYYGLMANHEVDGIITDLVLQHGLFPVYLNIEDSMPGGPAAYQGKKEELKTINSKSGETSIQYVNTSTVTLTLQGSEEKIQEFLDDLANNYPGIQMRSFELQENIYVDSNLQSVGQINCYCTIAVYTCGEDTMKSNAKEETEN